jgi:hypothetical protein
VGSEQDTALLMGFLLMRFAEEVERNPRPTDQPHITVVEEAHRLMAEVGSGVEQSNSRGAAGEDFSNILAEVRGYGEGIIIAEQIPTMLVKGAIGNTYLKLMHWLEDAPSFELFGNIMNLDERQREYARTLTPGFAIVRSPYGRPVHIKVPEFGDQDDFDREASERTSDEEIRNHMLTLREKLNLAVVDFIPWDAGLQAMSNTESEERLDPQERSAIIRRAASLIMRAPMLTCSYCNPLHKRGECPYNQRILQLIDEQNADHAARVDKIRAMMGISDRQERWETISKLSQNAIVAIVFGNDHRKDLAYCYLAHVLDELLGRFEGKEDSPEAKQLRKQSRVTLYEFHSDYDEEV